MVGLGNCYHYSVYVAQLTKAVNVQISVGSSQFFGMKLLLFWQILYHQQAFTMVLTIHRVLSDFHFQNNRHTHYSSERSPIGPFILVHPSHSNSFYRRAIRPPCDGGLIVMLEGRLWFVPRGVNLKIFTQSGRILKGYQYSICFVILLPYM